MNFWGWVAGLVSPQLEFEKPLDPLDSSLFFFLGMREVLISAFALHKFLFLSSPNPDQESVGKSFGACQP